MPTAGIFSLVVFYTGTGLDLWNITLAHNETHTSDLLVVFWCNTLFVTATLNPRASTEPASPKTKAYLVILMSNGYSTTPAPLLSTGFGPERGVLELTRLGLSGDIVCKHSLWEKSYRNFICSCKCNVFGQRTLLLN